MELNAADHSGAIETIRTAYWINIFGTAIVEATVKQDKMSVMCLAL